MLPPINCPPPDPVTNTTTDRRQVDIVDLGSPTSSPLTANANTTTLPSPPSPELPARAQSAGQGVNKRKRTARCDTDEEPACIKRGRKHCAWLLSEWKAVGCRTGFAALSPRPRPPPSCRRLLAAPVGSGESASGRLGVGGAAAPGPATWPLLFRCLWGDAVRIGERGRRAVGCRLGW